MPTDEDEVVKEAVAITDDEKSEASIEVADGNTDVVIATVVGLEDVGVIVLETSVDFVTCVSKS